MSRIACYSQISASLRCVWYRTKLAELALCLNPKSDVFVPSQRLEDKIRDLCQKAISTENDERMLRTFEELRQALHNHAVRLREVARSRLAAGLPITERRQKTPKAEQKKRDQGKTHT